MVNNTKVTEGSVITNRHFIEHYRIWNRRFGAILLRQPITIWNGRFRVRKTSNWRRGAARVTAGSERARIRCE